MSTSLYWRELPKEPSDHNIHDLKRIMASKFGQNDGSLGENLGTVDKDLIPFLEGIAIANDNMAEDAKSLIEAIKKYGEVELIIY